jgi:undecaprenyl diphosphate synthase
MIKHLALIMDGNRRWAKRFGLLPWAGHSEGAKTIETVVSFALEHHIPYVSLYAWSLENFKRDAQEQEQLWSLFAEHALTHQAPFIEKGVRVSFIGDRAHFPQSLRETIETLEESTKAGTALSLNILFCYGAQQEIMYGVKQIAQLIAHGKLHVEQLSEKIFEEQLWTSNTPPPDLIIRTGGCRRLSNFLLYQAAYSEIHFLDCLWPEITTAHLENSLNTFAQTQQNYGI